VRCNEGQSALEFVLCVDLGFEKPSRVDEGGNLNDGVDRTDTSEGAVSYCSNGSFETNCSRAFCVVLLNPMLE
jgi:hypothetical protein